MIGLHTIDEEGTIELDEEVFERSSLEPDSHCLVIASQDGGLTVMPVTVDFDPSPAGQ